MMTTARVALLAYRHGLRAAEVVDLRWEQVDLKTATLHVRRHDVTNINREARASSPD